MKALKSMLLKLAPLGVYDVKEGSNIYNELSAYSVGLDILSDELSQMLSEYFFATAESYGLEFAERMWGKVQDDKSIAQRRKMLLARSCFGYDDFTLSGISKVLGMLGITGVVKEYPKACRVTVDISDSAYSYGERLWIQNQLRALFPAHLEVDAVFSGFDWEDIDKKNLDFYSMERKDYTWQQIDLLV